MRALTCATADLRATGNPPPMRGGLGEEREQCSKAKRYVLRINSRGGIGLSLSASHILRAPVVRIANDTKIDKQAAQDRDAECGDAKCEKRHIAGYRRAGP